MYSTLEAYNSDVCDGCSSLRCFVCLLLSIVSVLIALLSVLLLFLKLVFHRSVAESAARALELSLLGGFLGLIRYTAYVELVRETRSVLWASSVVTK